MVTQKGHCTASITSTNVVKQLSEGSVICQFGALMDIQSQMKIQAPSAIEIACLSRQSMEQLLNQFVDERSRFMRRFFQ